MNHLIMVLLVSKYTEKVERSIPLLRREVRPFDVSADWVTAGQNETTFSVQTIGLIS